MKVVATILKVLAALAAIAGVVYVVATYGDQIVATLAAVDVLIGAIVTVAKNIYDREHNKIEDKTIY